MAERSGIYWDYDNIPLKIFIDIQNNKDLRLLLRYGIFNSKKAISVWESILRKNEIESKRNSLSIYFTNLKQYHSLLAKYLTIKAALSYLCLKPDKELITMLANYGYRIDTTDSASYQDSVFHALNASDNIITQLSNSKSELSRFNGDVRISYEETVAALSIALGFPVSGITLKQYNGYMIALSKLKNDERNKA